MCPPKARTAYCSHKYNKIKEKNISLKAKSSFCFTKLLIYLRPLPSFLQAKVLGQFNWQ